VGDFFATSAQPYCIFDECNYLQRMPASKGVSRLLAQSLSINVFHNGFSTYRGHSVIFDIPLVCCI